MQKIPGSPAYAVNFPGQGGIASPVASHEGFTDVTSLTAPTAGVPTGAAPIAVIPGRYAQLAGMAGTPGGQPINFGTSMPASSGSGGSGTVSSGSGTDPITAVADAFMAALGSAGSPGSSSGAPTILYPSAQVDDTTGGGGMNVKTIAIAAVIVVAAWYAWKKWGKPAASQ